MKYSKERPPKKGDKVRFTDEGLHIIGGLKNDEEINSYNRMTVEGIGEEIPISDVDVPVWHVVLAYPYDIYLITSLHLDLLE